MNEIQKLDKIMTGQIPHDFSALGTDTDNRLKSKFTWNDLDFNLTDAPYQYDTAIIVTSYNMHLGWLKATLTSYRNANAYVILAYDNSMYIWEDLDDENYIATRLPRPIHYLLAHSVVVKHRTYDGDKRTGWYWDVKYAQSIINGFKNIKYVYVTNGDCLLEKPEGVKELPSILGDGDLMSGQSTPNSTIHTANLFFKIDAFNKAMDYISERMRIPVWGSQSPELLLRDAVDVLKLKETFVKQPINPKDGSIDYYCQLNTDSTWKEVLGFRNLYHEFEYCENNRLTPDFKKFMDPYKNWIYFRESWKNTICKFYETGDKRYLMKFWDEGADSWEDRKFLPIEEYGKEPIWE